MCEIMFETDDVPKKKLEKFYKAPTSELIAYIDFSVSTTGMLSGVKVTVTMVMVNIQMLHMVDVPLSSCERMSITQTCNRIVSIS